MERKGSSVCERQSIKKVSVIRAEQAIIIAAAAAANDLVCILYTFHYELSYKTFILVSALEMRRQKFLPIFLNQF